MLYINLLHSPIYSLLLLCIHSDGTPTGDQYSGSDWDSHGSSDSEGSVTPPRRDLSRKASERKVKTREIAETWALAAEQAEDEALLELRLERSSNLHDDDKPNESSDAHLPMTAAVAGDVVVLEEILLDPPPSIPVEASAEALPPPIADPLPPAKKPEAENKAVVMRKPRLPPPLTNDDETLEHENEVRGLPNVEKPKRSGKAKKKDSQQRIARPPRDPPPDDVTPLQKPARALRSANAAPSTEALEEVLPKLLLSQVTRLPRPDSASPATAPEPGQLAARWTDYPTQLNDDKVVDSTDRAAGASGPSNADDDAMMQLDV